MPEPVHRNKELAGWLLLIFSLIWLAGFSFLIARACLFYRQKYDAQQVLEQFAKTARDETDRNVWTAELLGVV